MWLGEREERENVCVWSGERGEENVCVVGGERRGRMYVCGGGGGGNKTSPFMTYIVVQCFCLHGVNLNGFLPSFLGVRKTV